MRRTDTFDESSTSVGDRGNGTAAKSVPPALHAFLSAASSETAAAWNQAKQKKANISEG